MARTHGRIMAAIWNDQDFLALEVGPQRLYMFLLSQPDLSHAGLVPMRVRRWAKKVAGCTLAELVADLKTLEAARFVVTDDETEEVLVRTFVRNDGVYKQPKVMLRLREDAKQIESKALRAAFRAELERLPLDELSDRPGGVHSDQPSTRSSVVAVVNTLREDFSDVEINPSEGVSERVSDTPRVRAGAFHQPPTTIPQPPSTVPPTAGSALAPRDGLDVENPTAQTLVAEWVDHCDARPPGRVIGQVAKELKGLLEEGHPPEQVRSALIAWNSKGLHPSTLPSVLHEVRNARPQAPKSQQATDDLFSRAMARAQAREASA